MLTDRMKWLKISERLEDEIKQCRYEGKDIESLIEEAEHILLMEDSCEKEKNSREMFRKLEEAPMKKDFQFIEPESYEDIEKSLSKDSDKSYEVCKESLEHRIKGAWYGRSIGCLLGIPVEGRYKEVIINMLKESEQYPLSNYMHSNIGENIREKYRIFDVDNSRAYDRKKICWRNNVDSFPVDDDTNYTIAALRLIEEFGTEFTSDDVLETWLMSFPALHACTAERVAYQNALNMIFAPMSAKHLNPYREWIGAQIRGDFFGYVSPGNPKKAAEMAYKDAAVSHTKNGIYGEMYIAALISLSAVSDDAFMNCTNALLQIPEKSRLAEDINLVLNMFQSGKSYEQVIEFIHKKYNEKDWFDWCYVNPNTMLVVASVLYFERKFGEAICNTVVAGFDTDCNAATVGSILGMMNGYRSIEDKWMDGLELKINSSIHHFYEITLKDAVARTLKLIMGD